MKEGRETKEGMGMKVGYLVNTYPMPSQTFIRREIAALEARGLSVARFAARRWPGALADPADEAERTRTHYLLSGNIPALALDAARQLATSPAVLVRGGLRALDLLAAEGGGALRHAAYLAQAIHLKRQAHAQGITHIHAHFSTNAATVAMLAQAMGGPSFSFTAHGPDEFAGANRTTLPLKMQQAAFVVAISDYCRSILIELGGAEHAAKIHVARCGLDLAAFAAPPVPVPANHDVVCVGRLCPQKGQVLLPAIAARLRPDYPALRFILIGDGESRPDIEAEIARHGVSEMFVLRGWGANDEVRAAILAARALILPSYAEGLPIVLLEALALHRPVITTAIAGIPELVDASCGWIVPPGDTGALAAAVRTALHTETTRLDEMGRAGHARVAQRHDVRLLADTLEGLFRAPPAEPTHAPALSATAAA